MIFQIWCNGNVIFLVEEYKEYKVNDICIKKAPYVTVDHKKSCTSRFVAIANNTLYLVTVIDFLWQKTLGY